MLASGHLVLGGHAGAQHPGALPVPAVCLGPHTAAAHDSRLPRPGLCSAGAGQVPAGRPLPAGELHLLLPPQDAQILVQGAGLG